MRRLMVLVGAVLVLGGPAMADPLDNARVERVVSGLVEPWSIGFLPDGGLLITERGGRLNYFDDAGGHNTITGLPNITVDNQGGLFDVLVTRDFADSREIYLAFNAPATGTAVIKARLSDDNSALENVARVFTRQPPIGTDHHFGGRLVEDAQGQIFLTLGDHGRPDDAQNPSSHSGKIVMVRDRNGAASAQIYTLGHRNPQGMALGLDGQIYTVEHGAMGGDELNQIMAGRNYGWPIISYGVNYNGSPIGIGTARAGLEQPKFYWDPSIAPSGLVIYSGRLWPTLRGAFLVGSLKFDRIEILSADYRPLGVFAAGSTGRVRDVREAPDGSIWFLSVHNGAAYRLTPSEP